MSDNKTKVGWQDDSKINVNQDYELRDWARKLGVTPEKVKEAVNKVGPGAKKVREYLGK